MRPSLPRRGRLALLVGPLGVRLAALCAAMVLLLLCLGAPQAAAAPPEATNVETAAELRVGTVSAAFTERDAPEGPQTPGEVDDDLEDEREFELVMSKGLAALFATPDASLRSPARLLPPRFRIPGGLEKPPRV